MRSRGNYSFSVILLALLLLFGPAATVQAGPILTVYPNIGPNIFGSPYWTAYQTTAVAAIGTGAPTGGTPGTPAYYQVISVVSPGQVIVSSFPSWAGSASPTGNFANELGSRLYWGLHILGNGTRFYLTGLSNDMNSLNDPNNYWDFDNPAGSFNAFNAYTIGIDYGKDVTKGGGDDTMRTSGTAVGILIDELVYIGVGNAFDAGFWPTGTNQQRLDQWIAYINSTGLSFYNKYCLAWGEGENTCVETPITTPEPATIILLGAGLGLLAICRRRRR